MIHKWAGKMWAGHYTGLYPFPLMVVLAPISLVPVDLAPAIWFIACLGILVWILQRSSLYWILFVPFLQSMFLGQVAPLFWLIYRSKRPAAWTLLSLKPQLLLPALPGVFSSRRNFVEFAAASIALHLPFVLRRPGWPAEGLSFLSGYQNRLGEITRTTVSGEIVFSLGVIPYALLMGAISKIAVPLSWLALAAAWKFQAGWPYAVMMICVLVLETSRERRGPE